MGKITSAAGEKLSHAYIIASSSEAACKAKATRLAAAMLCESGGERPCGACRHCRKVMAGIHPDVVTIEREENDRGQKKREIPVGRIRAVVSDAQVMPNEAAAKVYVIADADAMNVPAQNAILKLLEEPPKSVFFILCSKNPANLLSTVRSRCILRRLNAEGGGDGEAAALAEAYLRLAASEDRAALLRWCAEHEGTSPEEALSFVRAGREAIADILCGRNDIPLPDRRCIELDGLFSRCERFLKLNTGTRHIFGLLAVDGIGGK